MAALSSEDIANLNPATHHLATVAFKSDGAFGTLDYFVSPYTIVIASTTH